jgi:predicted nicotinamide N-methyase
MLFLRLASVAVEGGAAAGSDAATAVVPVASTPIDVHVGGAAPGARDNHVRAGDAEPGRDADGRPWMGVNCRLFALRDVKVAPVVLLECHGLLGVGGRLWDCGIALLTYLAHNPSAVSGKRVLELGAGTGVVGLAASRLGAKHVVLTDLADVCQLISQNVLLSGAAATYVPVVWPGGGALFVRRWWQCICFGIMLACCRCSVRSLLWGNDADLAAVDAVDLVLAADVVYEPECFEPLLKTLRALATTRETTVLLAYRPRHPDGSVFFERVAEFFDVTVVARPDHAMTNVTLYHFQKK